MAKLATAAAVGTIWKTRDGCILAVQLGWKNGRCLYQSWLSARCSQNRALCSKVGTGNDRVLRCVYSSDFTNSGIHNRMAVTGDTFPRLRYTNSYSFPPELGRVSSNGPASSLLKEADLTLFSQKMPFAASGVCGGNKLGNIFRDTVESVLSARVGSHWRADWESGPPSPNLGKVNLPAKANSDGRHGRRAEALVSGQNNLVFYLAGNCRLSVPCQTPSTGSTQIKTRRWEKREDDSRKAAKAILVDEEEV